MALPRRMKFDMSLDGLQRTSLRIDYRLTREELATLLATSVNRLGVQHDGGHDEDSYAYDTNDIIRRNMEFGTILPRIKSELKDYGKSAMMYDGSDRVLEWARTQVSFIAGSDKL